MSGILTKEELYQKLQDSDLKELNVCAYTGFFDLIEPNIELFGDLEKLRICTVDFSNNIDKFKKLLKSCPKLKVLHFRNSKLSVKKKAVYEDMFILLDELIREGYLGLLTNIDVRREELNNDKERELYSVVVGELDANSLGLIKKSGLSEISKNISKSEFLKLLFIIKDKYASTKEIIDVSEASLINKKNERTEIIERDELIVKNGKIEGFRKFVKPALDEFLKDQGITNYTEEDLKKYVAKIIEKYEKENKAFVKVYFINDVKELLSATISNKKWKLKKKHNLTEEEILKLNLLSDGRKNGFLRMKSEKVKTEKKKGVDVVKKSEKGKLVSSKVDPDSLGLVDNDVDLAEVESEVNDLSDLKALKVKIDDFIVKLQSDIDNSCIELASADFGKSEKIVQGITMKKREKEQKLSDLHTVEDLIKQVEDNLEKRKRLFREASELQNKFRNL